jgi:hypothetical protein
MTADERLVRLDKQKAGLLAYVSGWPEELQLARPADGGWSALQVLDHMVRTESGICVVAADGVAAPQRIGVRDRLGFVFVERVFRSPLRVKVPGSVSGLTTPGEELELREITTRWDLTRVELARLADEADGCRGGVFKHPVSGWMSFEQVLRFFSVHMVHHEFQLERIRGEVGAT